MKSVKDEVCVGREGVFVHTTWGGKMVLPDKDLNLTPELSIYGEWEAPLTKFLLENVKNGDTVVDIGANVGYFSVLLGQLVGSQGMLHVYEANPFLYKYVMNNLSINDMHDRAHVSNVAVYSEETTIPFFTTELYLGQSSIYQHSEEYRRRFVEEIKEIKVKTVALDNQFSNMDKIDWLKIDIEGGEYHAFMGMQRLINENIVRTIVFELNRFMLQEDWEPFITLLTRIGDKGREFFLISDDGKLVPTPISIMQLAIAGGFYPYVVMK